mgnify:CR=1 FL=1
MSSENSPRLIRQSLERLLHGLGAPDIKAVTTLVERWPEVVGPELASGIKAVAVRGSELVVKVEDPAWASQIAWLESRLLERITDLVGPGRITVVKARVASRPGPTKTYR